MSEIFEDITRTSIRLMLKEPFFGHFFSGLAKKISPEVPMIQTRPEGYIMQLIVNPDYWSEELATPELRLGAIKHEMLHLIFKHPLRLPDFPNTEIFNVAADLVVNQYLSEAQLPEKAVLLEHFSDLQLEPEKELKYYYDKLLGLQQQEKSEEEQENEESEDPQPENQDMEDESGSENEKGEDQSGEGEGEGGESDSQPGEGDQASDQSARQWLNEFLSPDHPAQQNHQDWEDIKTLPQSQRDILDQTLTDAILNSLDRTENNKAEGDLPAGFLERVRSYRSRYRPALNWRRVLKLFLESSSRTSIKNTLKRPSKRYGTTPGIRIRRKRRLLVAVDTSGSVDQDDLGEFFNELYHVWKQGAEVRIVECDVEIQNVWDYKGQAPQAITGRGGTAFDAPIRYANSKFLPDAILYFTDGYADEPKTRPRCPMLWLISSNGISEGDERWKRLPGRKVKLGLDQ